jgi:flagellar motor switch protein FliN/FliY
LTAIACDVDEKVIKLFLEVWSSSICQVLSQLSGEKFDSRVLDSSPVLGKDESDGVWIHFSASAGLTGEMGFFVSKADALLLSGLQTGEAPSESAEVSGDVCNGLTEVFRRFAGVASAALKSKTKGEVELLFRALEPPSWEAALGFRLEVRGEKTRPLNIRMVADEGWAKSAATACATGAVPPRTTEPEKVVPSPASVVQGTDNIGLLLDIELEATLRFGEREMLLREILNLNSGSVIELDRRVNEPVELLVCGKVVAQGEVVVLDGNYAFRVTQIASPAGRMASLRI